MMPSSSKSAEAQSANRKSKLEPLHGLSSDPAIERDSKLIDGILDLIQENPDTSVFLRPFVSQFKVTIDKARRSLKRRIVYDKNQADIQISENEETEETEAEMPQLFDLDVEEFEEIKPNIGEYWSIKNSQSLYVIIETSSPLTVKYFQPSVKGEYHKLNDTIYEILIEDLGKKVLAPKVKNSGRFRQFYEFE